MLRRAVQLILPVLALAAMVLWAANYHFARRPVAQLTAEVNELAVPAASSTVLRLHYEPRSARTEAFSVTTDDLAAAAVTSLHAENGVLEIGLSTGEGAQTALTVRSGRQVQERILLMPEDDASVENEPDPPESAPPSDAPEVVYITPSGKRWHLSASHAGKNASAVAPSEVGDRTPCQVCAVAS